MNYNYRTLATNKHYNFIPSKWVSSDLPFVYPVSKLQEHAPRQTPSIGLDDAHLQPLVALLLILPVHLLQVQLPVHILHPLGTGCVFTAIVGLR